MEAMDTDEYELPDPIELAFVHDKDLDEVKIMYRKLDGTEVSADEFETCKQIVNICLDRKIDIEMKQSKYLTFLHFVADKLDKETFKIALDKNTKVDIKAIYSKNTLLHYVIEKRKVDLVQDLVELGADVNATDLWNRTPLFYAVWNLHYEAVKTLLKFGADVNAKDRSKKIPINYLFDQSSHKFSPNNGTNLPYWEIIELLCENGSHLDFNNADGADMVYDACRLGLLKEVKFLLKHGANLLGKHMENDTVLHGAVCGHNFELVEFLLHNGLDINVTNDNNETPLFQLSAFSHNSSTDTRSRSEKMRHDVEMIEFLVDNGASLNIVNIHELTVFENSVFNFAFEIMECLLELNFNVYDQGMRYIFDYNNFNHSVFNDYMHSGIGNGLMYCIAFLATVENDITEHIHDPERICFEWVEPLFNECKQELNAMIELEICDDSNVSYFEFLFNNLMEVAVFCRNEKLMQALETDFYKTAFPRYTFFLEKRIERAIILKHCMDAFAGFFIEFFENGMPTVVIDKILSFLEPGHVRNFARALHVYPKTSHVENML